MKWVKERLKRKKATPFFPQIALFLTVKLPIVLHQTPLVWRTDGQFHRKWLPYTIQQAQSTGPSFKTMPRSIFLTWVGRAGKIFLSHNTHPPLSPMTENVMTRWWKCTCLGNLLRGTLIGWTGTKEKHLIGSRPCPTITKFGRCHYCPGD